MYHKMIILGIDLCYNTFSHLGVQHQHYHEYDTVCLFIFLPRIVYFFSLIQIHTGTQKDDVSLAKKFQHFLTKKHRKYGVID